MGESSTAAETPAGSRSAGDQGAAPLKLVVVTGTGTEVGKTWVSARLLEQLRGAGIDCVARKPAQSFDTSDGSPRDADVLASATDEDPRVVCPEHRNYAVAMAPPMAAEVLGADPITSEDLLAELSGSWPVRQPDLGLVELAGGVRSPIASDADCGEFTAMVGADAVLLIADAGLGTINAVRSSLDSLEATLVTARRVASSGTDREADAEIVVYLNRYDGADELHRRNRAWLVDHGCGEIPVTPDELAARLI